MPRSNAVATTQQIADLAWAGQHAKAIDLATAALNGKVDPARQLDLLDVRAESYVALGDLERAGADAARMRALAGARKSAALMAQAMNRQALV
jgi:hypothetical protein